MRRSDERNDGRTDERTESSNLIIPKAQYLWLIVALTLDLVTPNTISNLRKYIENNHLVNYEVSTAKDYQDIEC